MEVSMETYTITYKVGKHFLPAIINGDYTGLAKEDEIDLEKFLKRAEKIAKETGAKSWHLDYKDDGTNFTVCEICHFYCDCTTLVQVILK